MANKKPFYKKFRRTLYETVSDSGNSVLRYRGHDDKEHYVASSEDPEGGGGDMTKVTWQELKDKRDAGKLIPGALYRITDYQCTTTQENTRSAGHQFDIVVLALSEDTLSEEAWAMPHAGDTYFSAAKLHAWKLMYCLDNDKERFAWADPENGKGVIYRLIDEFNNDCPYDFKNIQQLLPLVDEIEYDEDEGVDTWVYTLDVYDLINQIHSDASINGNRMPDIDEEMVRGVTNNLIEPSFIIGSDNPIQCLGKTAMIVSTNDEGSFIGMSSNSIKKYNGTDIPTRVLTNCIGCTILENVIFAIFIQCNYCILCNGSTTNRVEQSQLIYKISNQSYKWYIREITGAGNLTSFATMSDIGDIETALKNI